MIIKKRYFTLLETLIALSLTMILLTTLIGAYFQAERASAYWIQQEQENFPKRYLDLRLERAFSHLLTPDQNKNFFFTSENSGFTLPGTSSLIFSYDNGAIKNPIFSGSVLGRLYVDRQGNLTLLTWPDRSDWNEDELPPFHREVLMTHVTNLQWDFFHIPSSQDNEGNKEVGWKGSVWPKENKYNPGAIKLTLSQNDLKTVYIFMIPKVLTTFKIKNP